MHAFRYLHDLTLWLRFPIFSSSSCDDRECQLALGKKGFRAGSGLPADGEGVQF